jgi:signal transduction histidine kinase/CheY-like chemotaxis protein
LTVTIHGRLRRLILIMLLPIAACGIAGAYVLVKNERDTLARGVRDQARALLGAVDNEIGNSIAPLSILAQSPALASGDLAEVRAEVGRALVARRDDWVNLIVLDARTLEVVVNPLQAPGGKPLLAGDPDTLKGAIATGNPTVSKVVVAPLLQRPVFGVRLPVILDGEPRYVLAAIVDVAVIERLIDRLGAAPEATIGVLDSTFRFVARRPRADPGQDYASESLRAALVSADEGWAPGNLLDGSDIYRAFRRSPINGWYASIALPSHIVEQGLVGTWLMLAGFVAAAIIGLTIAWVLAGRITRPIAELARSAPALARGDVASLPPPSSIDELRELSQVLREAAIAIHERDERQHQTAQSLRDADRAKDEFLAILGHELRNPLASFANVAKLLEFAEKQPDGLHSIREILARQVAQMTHLLDDLLDVGRLTGGKLRLERAPADIAAIVGELAEGWQRLGRFAHHDVGLDLQPAWALVDRVRIEQIVSNLLDNALRHTPERGRIDVEVRAEGPSSVIEVRDTGKGIPPAMIERVFDLFVQGERAPDAPPVGLGIGLTMARRLVELHGGTIVAQSKGDGHGSSFVVTLPAIERGADLAVQAPRAAVARRRILVVEDNDDARDSLAALLRGAGHTVNTAASGEAGLRAALLWSPDVVIVDIELPDMDGYEVARHLRAMTGETGMLRVALTGYGGPDSEHRARAAGFDAYLVKPFDLAAFDELLANPIPVGGTT